MKTTSTDEQIKAIVAALEKIHVRAFSDQSSDPKYNAQKNLNGKTHYVEDDTLRFHKSRVLSARYLHGGLLFRIVCSDSMDPEGRKRGFRAVVHDLFGTTIYRPKLEDCLGSKQAALNACERETIDLVAHYRAALANKVTEAEREAAYFRAAYESLSPAEVILSES